MNKNLLAACKALLTMTGGPEGLDMGGPVDPKTVRQMAVKAIAEAEATPEVVFVAHEGDYSDRGVVGVYATRAEAEARSCDKDVEEWIVGNDYSVPGGYQCFIVVMDRDGNTLRSQVCPYFRGRPSDPSSRSSWGENGWQFEQVARDLTHAIKCVNEKRAQLIAEGTWL